MKSNINQKGNISKQAKLTPIRGEITFEMIHKLLNDIKSNAEFV